MKKKMSIMKKKTTDKTRTIRVNREVVGEVEKECEVTGVPIGRFFAIAAKEKLSRQELNN